MQPLTFASVKQLLARSDDPKLIDAADGLLGVVLVLGPTVVGMSPTVVLAALGLIGAKNELVKMGKSLYKWLTKPKGENEVDRQSRMAAAFCLIAYTAFFESLSKLPPDIISLLGSVDPDTLRATTSSFKALEGTTCIGEETNDHGPMSVDLPHPAETLDQLVLRLTALYQDLCKGFIAIVKSNNTWGSIGEKRRHETLEQIQGLPQAAGERLRAQYFDLAATYNEFSVWTNLREHAATQSQLSHLSKAAKVFISQLSADHKTIDLGLMRLRKSVEELPKAIDDYHANAVWKDLEKQYANAIQQPIIKDPGTTSHGVPTLKYPLRSDIFVPQSFKVLRYAAGLHLEDTRTWDMLPARKDIGEFLLAYLASDYSASAPLVILGHPGSGKSLLSQMIAAQTMSNAYAPIRLELRSINAENEIEAQIEEEIRKDIARNVSFSTLIDGLGGRPAVVIFDGYDELLQATGQVFAGYLTKVHKFQDAKQRHWTAIRCGQFSLVELPS